MTAPPRRSGPITILDVLLVFMVLVWGANYSLMKFAFQQVPPMAFNALRFTMASVVFVAGIVLTGRRARRASQPFDRTFYTEDRVTRRDWFDLVWLGVVGHCGYQLCWAGALTLTSASNGALIIGATPIAVTTASAWLGHERIRAPHWCAIAVSLAGIYLVVGYGAPSPGASAKGDLLMGLGVVCWAIYTLGCARLMARHSPLYVTGMTVAIGTALYVLLAIPSLMHVQWRLVNPVLWGLLVFAAVFPVNVSYIVWYAAVQRLGAARTSIYSNVVPLVAMGIAAIWLGEPLTMKKLVGAAAVLAGVLLTRWAQSPAAVPIEE
ncbi:MAG: DMT family transporter [Vicinamibacterales bacterium]